MTNYGSWDGSWVVPGIALPVPTLVPTPSAPPRVHPSTAPSAIPAGTALSYMPDGLKLVVGLKSVGQLTLSPVFSGLRGITEVYNLRYIGRINNHYHIPGNE